MKKLTLVFIVVFSTTIARAETYRLKLAGSSFSSVANGKDYRLDNTGYTYGVKLNPSWDGDSPTLYYIFELPPSVSGTYQEITLTFRGNGRTNIYIGPNQQNFGGSTSLMGTYTISLNSSYLQDKGTYSELSVGFEAYGVYSFSLDYVEIEFTISTQNKWLHYFIREREAARIINGIADVIDSFGSSGTGLNLEPYFVDVLGNTSRPGYIFEKLATTFIGEFSQLADVLFECIGILTDAHMLARAITGGVNFLNAQTHYSSGFTGSFGTMQWPNQTAQNIRGHANFLRTIADKWIEFGHDGNLTSSEISQLQSVLQDARNRLVSDSYLNGSVKRNIMAFIEGWKEINRVLCAENPDIFYNWVKPAVYGIRGGLWYETGNPGDEISGPIDSKSFIHVYESSLASTSTSTSPGQGQPINPTNISGTITQNTTWTLANSPYHIVGDVTVASGATLTIEAGVVIKFSMQRSGDDNRRLVVDGTLNLLGTANNKVVFTSSTDDAYGGDSNGDGSASSPYNYDWGYVKINSSSSTLRHAIFRFGGCRNEGNYMLWINSCSPTIADCVFENAYERAVYYYASQSLNTSPQIINNVFRNSPYGLYFDKGSNQIECSLQIKNNYIQNHSQAGIYLYRTSGGTVVSYNTILNNNHGIRCNSGYANLLENNIYNNSNWGVLNDTTAININAKRNWWGNAAGPRHAANPSGKRLKLLRHRRHMEMLVIAICMTQTMLLRQQELAHLHGQ